MSPSRSAPPERIMLLMPSTLKSAVRMESPEGNTCLLSGTSPGMSILEMEPAFMHLSVSFVRRSSVISSLTPPPAMMIS